MINKLLSVILCLIAIVLLLAGCELSEKIAKKMNLEPELVKRGEDSPGSKKCGDCHVDIYNEWANSLHAKSYASEEFRISTNDYEFEFCLGCHVPETIFTPNVTNASQTEFVEEEIKPRTYNLEDGIDCQSCHLTVDCTLAGPHSGMGPHPMEKKEDFYRRSNLCGRCHVETFKEYLMNTDDNHKETCQDCHMPAVKRKLIQDEPWERLHRRKEGKAHTFSSLSALKKGDDFILLSFTELSNENNQVKGVLKIQNNMPNHSIPTGSYGYREVLLLINLKNSLGETIKSKHESIFVEMDTQLEPMEKRKYPFTFNIDGINTVAKELEAILFRTDFNRTNKTLLAKVELELDSSHGSQ
ncbi:MAG: multiheme c-type cytochrome [Candidatus Scalinduaceae bacterium]